MFYPFLLQANVPNKFDIKVKRNNILEDAFAIISQVTRVDLLRTKLWIEFEGEVSFFFLFFVLLLFIYFFANH